MHTKIRDPNAFIHCLSAFLSASRSVAQYALKEAQTKPGGQKWYDSEVQSGKHIAFFKDERDLNIHATPVSPRAVFHVEAHTTLYLHGSADYRVEFVDETGQPVSIEPPPREQPAPPATPLPPKKPEVSYEFVLRPGDDILVLCEEYWKELKHLVANGQSAGYLTS